MGSKHSVMWPFYQTLSQKEGGYFFTLPEQNSGTDRLSRFWHWCPQRRQGAHRATVVQGRAYPVNGSQHLAAPGMSTVVHELRIPINLWKTLTEAGGPEWAYSAQILFSTDCTTCICPSSSNRILIFLQETTPTSLSVFVVWMQLTHFPALGVDTSPRKDWVDIFPSFWSLWV